jgi:hypothetical protein
LLKKSSETSLSAAGKGACATMARVEVDRPAALPSGGDRMKRGRTLQIVLALVGLLFVASADPLVLFARQAPGLSMMFSLYVTLGIFLLLSVRNPRAHRSLIAFAAWSSFAHATVMGLQAFRHMISRVELVGVALLVLIGVVLLALAPGEKAVE